MDRIDAIEAVRGYILSLLEEAAIAKYPDEYMNALEDIENALWKMI